MKRYILAALFIMCINLIFSQEKNENIFTTLVVIEEQLNGEVSTDAFMANGMFDALWDRNDYIFFDMPIDKPLGFFENLLDIRPFITNARATGADSVLLIKIEYRVDQQKEGFKINADRITFNLYSLNALKSFRNGTRTLSLEQTVGKKDQEKALHAIGYKLLNEIFN